MYVSMLGLGSFVHASAISGSILCGSLITAFVVTSVVLRAMSAIDCAAGAPATAVADVPVAPSKSGKRKWNPVQISRSQACVIGGFSNTPILAKSIDFVMGGSVHLFIELDKNASWFLKSVGGPGTNKGDLKAVDVIQDMRAQLY